MTCAHVNDSVNYFSYSSVPPHNVRVSSMLLEQMKGSSYDEKQICVNLLYFTELI